VRIVGPGDAMPTGQIPFTPHAKKSSSWRCASASASGTTRSARSTCCSASCATAKAWRCRFCSASTSTRRRCATAW
jgi:hypothetical protein